jgi:Putative peptidoglycan binding domain
MKTIKTLLIGSMIALSVLPGTATAAWWGGPHHDEYRYEAPRYRDPGPSYRTKLRAQARLRQLGFYRGPIDGDIGPGTRRAISRFQHHYGLPVTGWLDNRTLRALRVI